MSCSVCKSIDWERSILSTLASTHAVTTARHTGPARIPRGELIMHHANFANLEASAANGCSLCILVADCLLTEAKERSQRLGQASPAEQVDWKPLQICFEPCIWRTGHILNLTIVSVLWGDDQSQIVHAIYWPSTILEVYTQRSETEIHSGIRDLGNLFGIEIPGREISPHADEENVFRLANSWLNRCISSDVAGQHSECLDPSFSFRRDRDGTWLCDSHIRMPLRTVDVGPPDGSKDPFLAIHSDSETSSTPWATLSHCWGKGKQPLCTTQKSIESHKKSIPMDTLPQIFRDAIRITRRLSIRHLWIDSLCIVQDLKLDWEIQSQQMGSIYKQALVNIAPSETTGPDCDILTARTPSGLHAETSVETKNHGSGILWFRPRKAGWHGNIYGKKTTVEPGTTLHQRKWVYQEIGLSPRTLHFTSDQLYWECYGMVCSEDNIGPLPADGNETPKTLLRPTPSRKELFYRWYKEVENMARDEDCARKELYRRWYKVIEGYTSRHLTFPLDAFPAIAGVAAYFCDAIPGDRYLAGLLEGDLIRSLLWVRRGSNKPPDYGIDCYTSDYRAPSWSWASCLSPVVYDKIKYVERLDGREVTLKDNVIAKVPLVVEVEISPTFQSNKENGQHFGRLRDGHLTIQSICRIASAEDFTFPFDEQLGTRGYIAHFDNTFHADFEGMGAEFGHILLCFMGIQYRSPALDQLSIDNRIVSMLALMLVENSGSERTYSRIGVYSRPHTAKWFRENTFISTWRVKEVKII